MIYLIIYIICFLITFFALTYDANKKVKLDAEGVALMLLPSLIGPIFVVLMIVLGICHVISLGLNKLYGNTKDD